MQEQFAHDQAEADAKAKAEIGLVCQEAAWLLSAKGRTLQREPPPARKAAWRRSRHSANTCRCGTRQSGTANGLAAANSSRRRRRGLLQKIYRQRKEWDAKEKEMVAYRLVDLMGRASAANVLGITVRELDKLVAVFELYEKFTSLRDPSAAITWARGFMGV